MQIKGLIMTTIITIDGPAGSGKSTVAHRLAQKINASYLDTGAMYRAITAICLQKNADMADSEALLKIADECEIKFDLVDGVNRVYVDGQDLTEIIRSNEVTEACSVIAGNDQIRKLLARQQRTFATSTEILVTEGRDQGTLVFPTARFKFYLDASPECRALRRYEQQKTKELGFNEILAAQEQRDREDASRQLGALKPAEDSIIIDTTDLTINMVIDKLYEIVSKG